MALKSYLDEVHRGISYAEYKSVNKDHEPTSFLKELFA